MNVFSFHLMPYTGLPDTYDGLAWVSCSNALYDPSLGKELYHRYIDELILAEELGFDGVVVNEHHSTAYGGMPSPNLIAAVLARQTSRMKIAVVGNALPLYNPPTRVAEEWAMIDVISGGRLIAGMVVGGGPEYFASSINPVFARERFREAHDLIVKAWTAPGPFTFNGKHYRMRYVNPWPRPLQKPHPPIWIPGMGSLETMEFIAAKRYSFMGIPWFHRSVVSKNIELFKKACRSQGYEPSPTQMAWLAPIYVADTDARARAEYERHFWYFVKTLLRGINIQPPGYVNPKSIKNVVLGFAQFVTNVHTWEDVVSGGYAIVGSPETVRQKILEEVRRLGVANLLGLFHIGTLPAAETRRSLELFASDVMPWLKERSNDSVAQTGT